MRLSEDVLQGCQMWHFTQSFSLWAPSQPSADEETTIETVTHFWEQAELQSSALTALGHVWESVAWTCWGLRGNGTRVWSPGGTSALSGFHFPFLMFNTALLSAGHEPDPEMDLSMKTRQQWNNNWCNKWLLAVLQGWWPTFRCNKMDRGDKKTWKKKYRQKILLYVSEASLEFRIPGELEGPQLAHRPL